MKNIFKTLICLLIFQFATAQKKTTVTYFQNDTLKLDLDLFVPDKKSDTKLPLVIYVHGGGFSGGDRSAGEAFCKYLANNGFAAATISYTLYMKGKNFGCNGAIPEKIKAFQFGANDLWLATSFFIGNSQKYNLDASKIFIAGSSAGAETALHAAFWNVKTMAVYANVLPENFKYAGLISGAGAIMDLNLITAKNNIPTFLFHGSGDTVVPYGTAAHHFCKPNATNWLMLFGSYSIYNHLLSLNQSAALYTFCGGGHEFSNNLFVKDSHYLLSFLNEVLAGKKIQNHTMVPTGKTNEISAAYTFCE